MALGPPPWATVSFVPPPPPPLPTKNGTILLAPLIFYREERYWRGGGGEREEEITRRRRHRSLKLLLRMEKWARDGNLGSWTRRSETEERLLRTPPPTPLPSRHFHSRNDETTSDWIEDSRTSVRECDFSKSKKMMRINSRGFIMITYLFISIFSQRGNVLLLFPLQGGCLSCKNKIFQDRSFTTGKKMFAYRSRGRRRAPKGPDRRSLSREFRSRAPSPFATRPKPVSHTDIEIGVGPGSRL